MIEMINQSFRQDISAFLEKETHSFADHRKEIVREHKPNMNHRLKVGLIVDSGMSSKHVYELAEWGQRQDGLEISHLIVQTTEPVTRNRFKKALSLWRRKGLIRLMESVCFQVIVRAESLLLKRSKVYKHHFTQFDLSLQVKKTIIVNPIVSKSGFVYRYDDEDILKIKNFDLDVLIRCGSGILRGDILSTTRFGVISFHHADNRINRGGPPGFWEVYLRQCTTGFTIQQLTEELDGGNVLFQGHINTQPFYLLNQASLHEKSNVYLQNILSYIAKNRDLPNRLPSFPYYNPLYKRPSLHVQLNYIKSLMLTMTRKHLSKKRYRWGVAFQFRDWKSLVMWRAIKIPNPPYHFLADPFVVSANDEHFCFVEDYDYRISRGCISVYKLTQTGSEPIGQAIVEPFHMSYPCVFKFDSKYYICPETSENRDIRLYECESFPLKWRLKKIIMSDVSAVDTTIFEKDGLWWLFTNIKPTDVADHCTELHIYFSDNPLTDSWTPHPMNPIFVDSAKSRMGGIVFSSDSVYRASQRHGFNLYGRSLALNLITHLSKTAYAETTIFHIEPNFFDKIEGTHHLHSNGQVTVFDYVERSKIS